jgi:hypothetical protein
MLLFAQDWQKFPGAVVHTSTTNHSFLRMAEVYKKMGIKNCYFHLALMQPELMHVDPHAKNLTQEQMAMIGVECRTNPWYFFREVVRVPPQASAHPLQMRANRGNLALWWLFFNHVILALIQPRQTGKSLSVDELMVLLLDLMTSNSKINLLTKDDQLRKANIDRIKMIRNYLPKYLLQVSPKDSDNKEEVTNVTFNNFYRTAVGQSNEPGAINVGRGLTAPTAQVDEGPFISYIDQSVPAMLAAGTAARNEAEMAGAPYGTIFTTTAGKKDSRSGRYMYELISNGMPWTESLLDSKNMYELHHIVAANQRDADRMPIVNCTFSHRQLGYTDEWLMKAMKEANAFGDTADRDFFNVWTSGGLSSPLPIDVNEMIRGSQLDPCFTAISRDYYALRWYVDEKDIAEVLSKGKWILGMDTSEAIGRDAISMVLMNAENLEVIAGGNITEANLIKFSAYIADLMIKHENIILIPERRSTGQVLIDMLLERLPMAGIDPFKRIYNVIVDEQSERREEFAEIQQDMSRRSQHFYDRYKKNFGFTTSGSGRHSRGALYSDTLPIAARLGGAVCNDKPLINEVTGLAVKDGRIDHKAGGHDDMVIAWLLCVWMLVSSKNLHYYGITNAMVNARDGRESQVNSDPYVDYEKQEQLKCKDEIDQLFEELKKCSDEFIALKLERRIKTLDGRLKDQYSESTSVDALIREAAATRSKKIREAIQQRNERSPHYYRR